jgi:hypothetical protein
MLVAAPVRFSTTNGWPSRRQPLPHHARDGVGIAASGKTDDDAHWPRRILLRPSEARHGRQRGSACGQMQKISAGKFHF